MTVKANEFNSESWSHGLWPITAILGAEVFFIMRIGDSWRQLGRKLGYGDRLVIDQEHADASSLLLEELNTLSLFADRTLVELRLARTVLDKGLKGAIQGWIDRPPEDKRLLISGGQLGKSEILSDWYSYLDKIDRIIDASIIPSYQFPKWLDQELSFSSIEIEPDGKQAILAHTQGNMLAAEQVVKKLKLIQSDQSAGSIIILEQVIDVLTQSARYTVYDLVDLALKADIPNVNRVSDLLIAEGVSAMSALWAIHRQIVVLLQIRHRIDHGESANQAISTLRVWRSRTELVHSVVNRLNLTQLRKLLTLCSEADQTIKGRTKEPAWSILKDILFGLSGLRLHR